MKMIRGFRLKHRISTVFRRILRRNRPTSGYLRLDPPTWKSKSISRLFSCLKRKAKSICSANYGRISTGGGGGYVSLNGDREVVVPVPKGKMAVYVGQQDGDFHRFLVPVIYFNHPLFGELLREAEEEYGFKHPGGITIPCRISEFERVKTQVAAACGCRKFLAWKKKSSG
ncbi:hypothetical protein U1Q18_036086 [Sarracenia purpurea var. burkii]